MIFRYRVLSKLTQCFTWALNGKQLDEVIMGYCAEGKGRIEELEIILVEVKDAPSNQSNT